MTNQDFITKEKKNLKHDKEYALSLFNKFKGIRSHTLNFAIISFVFALVFVIKFGILWVSIPLCVVGVILLFVRKSYKFKFDVATVLLFGTVMVDECIDKGIIDPDQIVDFSEKKVKDIENIL